MRLTWVLALRSVWVRPARTLLTASGITLGVAVILAVSISRASTMESVVAHIDETAGRSHLIVASASSCATLDGLDRLQASLHSRLGEGFAVLYPAGRGRRGTEMPETSQLAFRFFSAVALFVGALLIYNAFSMTVAERTREIGMLRTVGMTRRLVFGQILTEAAVLGSIGAALGAGLGLALARGISLPMELLPSQEVRQVEVALEGLVTSLLVGIVKM